MPKKYIIEKSLLQPPLSGKDQAESSKSAEHNFPVKTIAGIDASEMALKENDLECVSKYSLSSCKPKRKVSGLSDFDEENIGEEGTSKLPKSEVFRLLNERKHSDASRKTQKDLLLWSTIFFEQLYIIHRTLGRGGFGVVFHYRHHLDGLEYAVKAIPCRWDDLGKTLRECFILARINHPNVVRYQNSWVQARLPIQIPSDGSNKYTHTLFIVMEYCTSTLANDLVNRKEEYLSEFKKKIFDGHIQGLAQLEVMKIVHRDLSPDNIFFDEKWNSEINDFGLAMYLDHRITWVVGKDLYNPNEGEEYITTLDMFLFALCMFDMFYAYPTRERFEHLKRVKNGILPLELKYPDPVCRMLNEYVFDILKAPSPDARLKATVMVQHYQ